MERQEQDQPRTEDIASGGGDDASEGERGSRTEGTGEGERDTRSEGTSEPERSGEGTSGRSNGEAGGRGEGDRGDGGTSESDSTPLLPSNEASELERRWQDVQVGFVDEPQRCVKEADGLVAEVMQKLADGFARERKDLESQWASGGEPSTEDLRVALQRYRSFFNRLLKTS